METVRHIQYVSGMVCLNGGCEATVTAKAKYGWAELTECSELL